jgi:hypothetical protein
MQEIPNIVRERLRAATTESLHPDADVLTAFAEKSLTERERGTVLEHLARCRDCRDVVGLALPELAEPVVTPSPVRGWSWPALRWGLAVAGIVIVASFGVMQYRRHAGSDSLAKLAVPQNEQVQPAVAPAPVQPAQAQSGVASSNLAGSLTASDTVAEKNQKQRSVLSVPKANADNAFATGSATAQLPLSGRQITKLETLSNAAPEPRNAAPAMAPGARHGVAGGIGNRTVLGGPLMPTPQQAQQQSQAQVQTAQAQALPGPVSVGGNLPAASGAVTVAAPSQVVTQAVTVEVSGAASSMQAETATLEPPTQTIGGNDAEYLSRAKPAMTHPLPGGTLSVPYWSLNTSGGLLRSFDQGKTWQDIDVTANAGAGMAFAQASSSGADLAKAANQKKQAATPTFRAVTAMGTEVWAGGLAGALYHSADAGARWTRVVPSWAGAALSGDIVSIAFSDSQHGKISTSSSEVWTTTDDGRTWQKQ